MTADDPALAGQFTNTLVGLQNTEQDAGLLAYLAVVARASVVREVSCVHVLVAADGRDDTLERDQAMSRMRSSVAAHLGGSPTARVEFEVRAGPLLDQLLAALAEHRADVALIGHKQDHPMRRSLARRLAKLSPCSIWMVPDGAPAVASRILVPIDFSQSAGHALAAAAGIARRLGVHEITAAHVYFDAARTSYAGRDEAVRGREHVAFANFLAPIDTGGVRVSPVFLEGVHPADAIRRLAEERGIDLIVLGMRGHSRSAAVLIGSVAEETLVQSRVPVLVVRAPGKQVGMFRALMELLWRHPGAQFD